MPIDTGKATDRREPSSLKQPQWLSPESWPRPKWMSDDAVPDRTVNFETLSAHQLRARYSELEGDFRTVVGKSPSESLATAQTIFELLTSARENLERKHPQLLAVANQLALVEQYMVWLFPTYIFDMRRRATLIRLEKIKPSGWESYHRQLAMESGDPEAGRAALDEALGACNRHVLEELISNRLQVRRLARYRVWSVVVSVLLLVTSPLLAKSLTDSFWSIKPIAEFDYLTPWVPGFCMLLMGMLGGFISGLLQVKSSRATLVDYSEGMVLLGVRPLFGGLAALVLFSFLSWDLIPAIKMTNEGTYIFVAFLAGFSERYFLRLVEQSKPLLEGVSTGEAPGALSKADKHRLPGS